MEMWQKYIEKKGSVEPVLKTYLKLRRLFQSYDWSESDLHNPPYYSRDMMILRDEMNGKIGGIMKELHNLGIEYTSETLISYLQPFMSKIDELTPLKYGNHERRNQGDEDN